MTLTSKILMLCLFLSGVVCAQSSGSFTSIDFDDSYIDYDNANTNYGSNVGLKVGHMAGRLKSVLRCMDCDDSLIGRVCDSATITLDVTAVKGTLSLDDSIEVYALLTIGKAWGYTETGVTWNSRDGENNWNTAGADGSGSDYWATRIAAMSVTGWTTSTNPVIDVEMAYDSGQHGGFLIRKLNFDSGDTLIFASHDVMVGTAPTSYIAWHETTFVQTMYCAATELTGTTTRWIASEFKMLSFDAYLDSAKLDISPAGTATDTIRGLTYKNYAADSALYEWSADTAYTASEASCAYFVVHFAGTTVYEGDSNYFVGAHVQSGGAGAYRFCTTTGNNDGRIDSSYYAAGAAPDPVAGTRVANRLCSIWYFTAVPSAGGQVIIIGSCESPETPYFDERTGQWLNVSSY